MSLYLVTPPARVVVSLDDMKEHLRVDHDSEDDLIEAYTAAATAHIDGRDGWLQRALVDQTWDFKPDCWPSARPIRLPLPPLIEVVSFKYIDTDGVEQTFDDANYHVTGVAGYGRGSVQIRSGETWPVIASQWPEPIAIRFRAGYLDTSESPNVDNVPEPIKQAIKFTVGHLYANRETVVIGQTAVAVPFAAEYLLSTYRVY